MLTCTQGLHDRVGRRLITWNWRTGRLVAAVGCEAWAVVDGASASTLQVRTHASTKEQSEQCMVGSGDPTVGLVTRRGED